MILLILILILKKKRKKSQTRGRLKPEMWYNTNANTNTKKIMLVLILIILVKKKKVIPGISVSRRCDATPELRYIGRDLHTKRDLIHSQKTTQGGAPGRAHTGTHSRKFFTHSRKFFLLSSCRETLWVSVQGRSRHMYLPPLVREETLWVGRWLVRIVCKGADFWECRVGLEHISNTLGTH